MKKEALTLDRAKKIIQTSLIGVGVNMVLVAFKALVGVASGSIAIVLDAINNLSDAFSSVVTIIGTKLAGKAPDKQQDKLCSASGELQIKLRPEVEEPVAGQPIYIDLGICDKEGTVERNCDKKVKIKVEGGTLLAFGSANPRTEESYILGEFTTYYGKAQAVVLRETAGEIKVTAVCPDLKTEIICISVKEQK